MTPSTFTYRVFPSEVVSNTHDFEVRPVVHNHRRMRGVFARRAIAASECSLYVGAYPGYRKKRENNTIKVASYSKQHKVDERTAIRKVVAYCFSLRNVDPGYVLDPTDEQGNLLPEFIPYIACYVNEPPPDSPTKTAYVYNRPRQRYEVWLLHAVAQDEEVFVYYGGQYLRDYPINPDGRDEHFCHFIPAESILKPDRRGIPPPLCLPDISD